MARLRQETALQHTALDQGLNLSQRLRGMAPYRALLERFYGIYEPLETQILSRAEPLPPGLELEKRRKIPLLQHDLSMLGKQHPLPMSLPCCTALPALDSPAALLGCLYVLEGSTLGGQHIARELRKVLGLTAEDGGAFFSSYGAEVGTMWRAFGAIVDACPLSEDQEQQMISAARDTFTAFHQWLCVPSIEAP
ncbi:MAG: biliverdin-producing heme oxygenase [Chloroflexota bacterium]